MIKKSIVLLLILVFIVGCGKTSNKKEASLLVSYSSYQLKVGATYDGLAIFDDGSIYSWYFSSTKSDYNNYVGSYSLYTASGFREFVHDKWSKRDENISNSDLKKIQSYVSKLKKSDSRCVEEKKDYSDLTIYKNDEAILFSIEGDCSVVSTNSMVKELLDIVLKYKK